MVEICWTRAIRARRNQKATKGTCVIQGINSPGWEVVDDLVSWVMHD